MRKFWIWHVGLVTAALMLVAACGAGSNESSPLVVQPTPTTTQPTTVTTDLAVMDSLCSPAPEGVSEILALPAWEVGTVRQYVVQRAKVALPSEKSSAASSRARLTVLEAGVDGWLFEWESEEAMAEQFVSNATVGRLGIEASAPRKRIVYRVGRDRQWLGVENTEELRASAIESIGLIRGAMDDSVADSLVRLYGSMDEAGVSAAFADEVELLHALEGVPFPTGEMLEIGDVELPNSFGGPAIPARTTMRVIELVDQDGCAGVEMRSVPDPDLYPLILVDSIRSAFPDASEAQLDQLAEQAQGMELSFTSSAKVDAGGSWIRSVSSTDRASEGTQVVLKTLVVTDETE